MRDEEMRRREQKKRVKSSGSWSQCFREKDIKNEGRC